jgi:phenylalanyl-tRNA synthetase beta subunit
METKPSYLTERVIMSKEERRNELNISNGSLLGWLESEKASAFEEFSAWPYYDRDAARWLSRHETMDDVINYIKENKTEL